MNTQIFEHNIGPSLVAIYGRENLNPRCVAPLALS